MLNYGNQQFQVFAPSQSASAGTESAAADAFWLAPPVFNNLLAFNYPVSALPAGFEVGVQQPTHRRMDGQKRQQPDSGSLAYPRLKKSKPGSGRQTSRQHGDHKGRMSHMPELSPKLQQRLATLLVLVSADADSDPSGVKQACAWHAVASCLCPVMVSAHEVGVRFLLRPSHSVPSLHHSQQCATVLSMLYVFETEERLRGRVY